METQKPGLGSIVPLAPARVVARLELPPRVRRARDRRALTVRGVTRVRPRSVGGVLQGIQRDEQKRASATPTMSPDSRSAAPIKGNTCRLEATKCFCPERKSGCGSMSTK